MFWIILISVCFFSAIGAHDCTFVVYHTIFASISIVYTRLVLNFNLYYSFRSNKKKSETTHSYICAYYDILGTSSK